MTVEALLKHPALWKGRQQHEKRDTFATGHTALDLALPSGGWPVGALTELMVAHEGVGEFTLLLPALAALTQQQQWIALVAPPYIPYAPALVNAGIALERLLIINCGDHKDAYWATEQLLRSGVFSSVVLWTEKISDERRQRRLQLAAEVGKAWAVCYRPRHADRTSSPASLRIVLQNSHHHLQANIIKNRGGRLCELKLMQPATPVPGLRPEFRPGLRPEFRQAGPDHQSSIGNIAELRNNASAKFQASSRVSSRAMPQTIPQAR